MEMEENKHKLDTEKYLELFNKEFKCTVLDIVFYVLAIVAIGLETVTFMRLLNWNMTLALKMLGAVGVFLVLFWWSVLTD